MKLFKRKTIIIAFLVVAFVLAGMYPMLHKKNADVETSNTLKLYAVGTDSRVSNELQDTLDEFQKKYPNIKIKKTLFDVNNIEKYEKTLLSDTLAGKGPDVLYLTSSDAKKLQKSGMLEDLKTLMDKDKSFNKEDYNNKIINAGMYNGKLTLMPLDYYVNQYATTKELLNSNGINLKADSSEKDFIKAVESGNLNGGRKLFAAVGGVDPVSNMNLSDFLAGSGYQFIDYENKKVYFDKPEFKELIEDYKKIYKASSKKDAEEGTSGEEGLKALKSGAALFSNDRMDSFKDFLSSESLINGITKEKPCINNMPMLNGGNNVVGIISDSMAINKNSKNKGAAYNFIKCALSTEVQSKASGQTACIPVNNKVVKELEDEYKSGIGKSYEYDKNDTVVQKPLSTDFQNYVNKVTNNVEKGTIIDDSVNKLMMECLTPYFEDKTSYESALNTLQSKVKIYINE